MVQNVHEFHKRVVFFHISILTADNIHLHKLKKVSYRLWFCCLLQYFAFDEDEKRA